MNKGIIKRLFPNAVKDYNEGKCSICGKKIKGCKDFEDRISMKEYTISGMCQECQDKVFK